MKDSRLSARTAKSWRGSRPRNSTKQQPPSRAKEHKMGDTTKKVLLKTSIEHALQEVMDAKRIKSWYYNGEFHVTTTNGTFTIKING